ncbi:MAG: hypothetical protein COU35_02655 [Candidatus Magasanikbacteria bacterium CG10_big_fil_rev_8_21_14_0_10_47_10]|uniref:Uncharacterized protein n=1 Tax=Candidatus Magasanikbacteria bacterium CG10_big_fil_rev_8_21_14_0_10_47_10 TaxID=1974652 RepID=A0A2H0TQM8_9BACT|nr:MAG: hypothetical protein COU35_02655 [Candidatus Magasanikbacteria bacterium CG10_big_fil_rev_8_21_14_0_10_47_10]
MGGNTKGGTKRGTINEVLEIVKHIQDNAVTRQEFHEEFQKVRGEISEVRNEILDVVRSEISSVRNEMIEHVDGFIGLHSRLETEVVATKSAVQRHEEYFDKISTHSGFKFI